MGEEYEVKSECVKRKFVRNDGYKKIKEKNDNCKYLVF